MTDYIGSVDFGPNWNKPTAVGAGDGGTFIAQPVYRHEIAKLMGVITKLETRITALEAKPTSGRPVEAFIENLMLAADEDENAGHSLQAAYIRAAADEIERLRAALQRLADCDWVITPGDRMDAVRKIARDALGGYLP